MEVVNLGDDTLLPGLVDSHVHLCFDPATDPVQQMLDDEDTALLDRAGDSRSADHTDPRPFCWFLGGEADGTAGVRAAVAERVERGVDVIKVMATGGMLTPGWGLHESQYGPAELRGAVDAAHAQGLLVTAHAHGPRGIADAVAAGVDGVEHGTFVTATGVEPDAETIAAMAWAGTFVGVTEAWLPDGPPLPPVAAQSS